MYTAQFGIDVVWARQERTLGRRLNLVKFDKPTLVHG